MLTIILVMIEAIQSIEFVPFLVILSILVVITVLCIQSGLKARRIAAIITKLKTSKIAFTRDGYVEFEGKVQAIEGKHLESPLTHSPCCWYEAKVEEYALIKRGGKSTHDWRTVRWHRSEEPFFMNDGSGICTIYPSRAELTPTDKSIWYGPTLEPTDRNPKRAPHGTPAESGIRIEGTANTKFRYTEERIYDGDPLFAIGHYSREAPEADDEDILAQEEYDPDGLEAGWLQPGLFKEMVNTAQKITMNRLFSNYKKEEPLIVSTTPQDKLLESNRLRSIGALGFGGLFMLLTLTYVCIYFLQYI